MKMIKLTNDGRLLRKWWDSESRQYIEKEITNIEQLFVGWHEPIFLDEDASVRDLMIAIKSIPDYETLQPLFHNAWMKEFMEEAFKEYPGSTDLVALEFSWATDLHTVYEPKKGSYYDKPNKAKATNRKFLSFNVHLSGVGPLPEDEDPKNHAVDENGNIRWAIDFTPINQLIDLKIVLNPKLEVYPDFSDRGDTPYEEFMKPILVAEKQFTLGEFLYAFFWEISFHGGPDSRNAFADSLAQTIENIENGTEELTSMDDILAELEAEIFEDEEDDDEE